MPGNLAWAQTPRGQHREIRANATGERPDLLSERLAVRSCASHVSADARMARAEPIGSSNLLRSNDGRCGVPALNDESRHARPAAGSRLMCAAGRWCGAI